MQNQTRAQSIKQKTKYVARKGAQAGRMRGAIMPSLIFFVTFFHQGKKVREDNF